MQVKNKYFRFVMIERSVNGKACGQSKSNKLDTDYILWILLIIFFINNRGGIQLALFTLLQPFTGYVDVSK